MKGRDGKEVQITSVESARGGVAPAVVNEGGRGVGAEVVGVEEERVAFVLHPDHVEVLDLKDPRYACDQPAI